MVKIRVDKLGIRVCLKQKKSEFDATKQLIARVNVLTNNKHVSL